MTGGLCLLAGVLAGLAMARSPTSGWMLAAALAVIVASWPALRGHAGVRALAAGTLGAWLANLAIGDWRIQRGTGVDLAQIDGHGFGR